VELYHIKSKDMVRVNIWFQIVAKSIAFLFIVLFVYAATSKLLDYENFKVQLVKSPYISNYADTLVWGLPLLEYTIAGLFLFSKYIQYALYASLFLMTLFTAYIFMVLHYSDVIPCACGGVLALLGWKDHFIFNIAFMAFAVLGILITPSKETSEWTEITDKQDVRKTLKQQ
jgi:hypothetical protein